ncbi:MAG: 50S ribosomal protein L29 [Cytophagales bacterium]|nr:MAG: 50S ribosomal protein L29 [Cytophagales bacterium]
MSKNKENFKDLSLEELKEKVAEEKQRLFRLQYSHAVSPIENPMTIKEARKTIARLLTTIQQKTKSTSI